MPHAPRARWRRSLATQSPGREAEIVRRARRPRRGAAAPSSTAWALASLRSVTLHFAPGAARQALVGDAQASTRTARAESGRRTRSHGRGPWAAAARITAEPRSTAQRACLLRKAERRRRRSASTESAAGLCVEVDDKANILRTEAPSQDLHERQERRIVLALDRIRPSKNLASK